MSDLFHNPRLRRILRLWVLPLLALAGAYSLGIWSAHRSVPVGSAATARRVLYYVDPMHPAYKSDKPGIAPDCGMELVPVYEDTSTAGTSAPPGTVSISPEKQQLIGVQTTEVNKAPGHYVLRVLGRVVPDETRLYPIKAATEGLVKTILPVTTGGLVEKDELLATFYPPDLLSVTRSFMSALTSSDQLKASGSASKEQLEQTEVYLQTYRIALRNLGMTELQVDEIQRTRQSPDSIEIRAPAAGLVLTRNVSPGLRFEKGMELYRIADLSQVWIVADTFGTEASDLKPGTQVVLSSPHLSEPLSARVADIPPVFDASTRTLKVRLEADNPGLVLRPDMFVDLDLPVDYQAALVVPADAVVDAGTKRTVYVDKGAGVLEPRKVETGWRHGDRVEIVKGLMPGERIVVAGTFLVDSESRMKAARAGIYGDTSECPVCGMAVDQAKAKAAGLTSTFAGRIYYFCSNADKAEFDQAPARYAGDGGTAPMAAAGEEPGHVE